MRRKRRQFERDLHEEIGSFQELLTDEKRAAGLPPNEARRQAAVELGGADAVMEGVRDVRVSGLIESWGCDFRFGARLMARNKAFSLLCVLILTLGIGANTAVFSLIRGVLLRPPPYPEADRIATVSMDFAPQNNPHGNMSVADFLAWRDANHAFLDPGIYQPRAFNLVGGTQPEQKRGARVTSGFFATLGVKPLLGRTLQPSDDLPASPAVVVISESFWQQQFGGRGTAIGEAVKLDGTPATVVGIMPATFHFPQETSEIWANLPLAPPTRLGPYFYRGLGRLRPGVTLAQAQAETNTIGHRMSLDHPEMYSRLTLPVESLGDAEVGRARLPLLVLLGAAGLILLIAIVNVAHLLLARAQTRAPEMAIRASLGAGRARLVRQLLAESLLLAIAGGAGGGALAYGAVAWLRQSNPAGMPRMEEVRMDGAVFAWALASALAAGMLMGLVPALRAARTASLARAGARAEKRQSGAALVVMEVALAVVLLAGAGLLLRSYAQLQSVNAGFTAPANQTYATGVVLSGPRYASTAGGADSTTGLAFDAALLERARALPGVTAAALSDAIPPAQEADDDTFTIQGRPWTPGDFPSVPDSAVSPGYFSTLGIPLLAGRDFSAADAASAAPVIIVSQSVARHHFPGQSPLGHFIKDGEPSLAGPYARIVGVVADVKYEGLGSAINGSVYRPAPQNFDRFTYLIVRSPLPAAQVQPALRAMIQHLEPEAVILPGRSLEDFMADDAGPLRFQALLLGVFALLALTLAASGIYGVIAYRVSRRKREIGIRTALGARPGQILTPLLRQGAQLAILGLAIGTAGALALTRLMAGILFRTDPADPLTYIAVAALLAAVALGASYFPARRALHVDPLQALRSE